MTDTKEHQSHSSAESTPSQYDPDATEYQTLRGCLVLSALTILCGIILVACILLFGKPIQ